MVSHAWIKLWGETVGAVIWQASQQIATFEFDPSFIRKGLDLAPVQMPLAELQGGSRIFSFPGLPQETFKGLPGLLADSLPDRFGNQVIDAWLARQGRSPASFHPVERLCYTGRRGMGALEFEPARQTSSRNASFSVDLDAMVALVGEILSQREQLEVDLSEDPGDGLNDILRVGTSAGGARAKAILAIHDTSGKIRSGQVDAPKGYSHWMIKFDGVNNATLSDPKGYGRIEYAYFLMATAAGIQMSPCKLLQEGGRAHFMTKRFDRNHNQKLHMQTLCAIAHFDYNDPNSFAYEQAFQVMRQMRLPYPEAEQLYIRMIFNVIARNQDDHTKNISFLMDPKGKWTLSPAYDVTYAFDPNNKWLRRHQLSVNGKREGIILEDLLAVAREMNI
ncbi:MAG TPA: type II toxin-antitoxin system HipA family toxin, partial [Bacteroidetes bacterium]|nr:type II toxin-antitoxin system HipA family toxin [Bacteroidota bacterium]